MCRLDIREDCRAMDKRSQRENAADSMEVAQLQSRSIEVFERLSKEAEEACNNSLSMSKRLAC